MLIQNNIYYYIYCLIVLLIIYQDSPFALIAGAFGYSTLNAISLFIFPVLFFYNKGRIKLSSFEKNILYLFCYLFFVSYVSIFLWVIVGNNSILLGEDIFIKTNKVLLSTFSFLAFIKIFLYFTEHLSVKEVLSPFFWTFILLAIVCVFEYMTLPYAFDSIHFTGMIPYWRIRLLTKESSWTAMMILVYGTLAFYYSFECIKNNFHKALALVSLFILIVFSSSKALLIILLAVLFGVFLLRSKRLSREKLLQTFLLGLVVTLAIIMIIPKLTDAIEMSLQWSSIPTRSYTILIGLLIGIFFPFGIGTSLHLYYIPKFLKEYISFLDIFDSPNAYIEVYEYIYAISDEFVSVKSGLIQYNIYWGIIGTIIFIYIIYSKIYKRIHSISPNRYHILEVAFFTSNVLVTFNSDFSFEYWSLLAVIWRLGNPEDNMEEMLK